MGSSIFRNQNNQIGDLANKAKAMMNDSRQMQNVMGMLSGKGMSAEQMVRSICTGACIKACSTGAIFSESG